MPLRKAQKFQRLPGFFAPIFRGVTDGGVALNERHADAAGGLSCEARQRDRRNRCRHVELKKAAVDGQNHSERQHPDEQRTANPVSFTGI